jgi:hypothetical protein
MRVETFRCDNCDKARDKDVNHWSEVLGRVCDGSHVVGTCPLGLSTKMGGIPADSTITHACGDECRFALMARYLATGSFQRSPAGVKAGE